MRDSNEKADVEDVVLRDRKLVRFLMMNGDILDELEKVLAVVADVVLQSLIFWTILHTTVALDLVHAEESIRPKIQELSRGMQWLDRPCQSNPRGISHCFDLHPEERNIVSRHDLADQ